MAFSVFVINISQIPKTQYRIVMQDKISKFKNFKVTHKSVESVKVFSLEIFRLYGTETGELHHMAAISLECHKYTSYLLLQLHKTLYIFLTFFNPSWLAYQTRLLLFMLGYQVSIGNLCSQLQNLPLRYSVKYLNIMMVMTPLVLSIYVHTCTIRQK